MNESVRKRRRTNSPQDERDRQSSPLRRPPRRPSFASPTKSSLARNYPDLLPTNPISSPARRPTSRGGIPVRGQQARASTPGDLGGATFLHAGQGGRELGPAVDPPQTDGLNTTPRAQRPTERRHSPRSRRANDDEEPELPPTPSQRGLEEQDGPRRGILFSSPSKRPPRVRKSTKQSPSRPKAAPTQELDLTRADDDIEMLQPHESAPVKHQPRDPDVERREQERAELRRELELLEAQVSKCSDEILQEQQRSPDDVLHSSARKELIDFMSQISGAVAEEEQPLPISDLLCSFLPFSAMSLPRPSPTQPEKPVASHKPVELADPLPYLEMFTAFKFSTQLNLPRGKTLSSSNRVQQKHTIAMVGPQRLLNAELQIVIDALKQDIIDVHILSLSQWAERELGTFMRKKAFNQDLGNIGWAVNSYWDVATKRAQYWHRCEKTFAHLITGNISGDIENIDLHHNKSGRMSRKDLSQHLGQDTLVLQDKHVLLKLKWKIGFDWTGEAESEIAVEAGLPAVWTEADANASFKRVPETFTALVQSKGVFQATRVMATLLFSPS
ncbi:hypothetical protein ACN47E_005744 [Coniothyrium glycines]